MGDLTHDGEFEYSRWRHGGWYVHNVRWPNGGCGCVSNKMCPPGSNEADGKWRIACDTREEDHTYPTRNAAARAERDLIAAGILG